MLRTFGVKIFVSDFCEDDAVIPRYCKEDEQKDAEKIPPKAWFVLFPYSIIDNLEKVNELLSIRLQKSTRMGGKRVAFCAAA